jgi:8-oxo-dGTP pyrophosphatase MutT (NUDIX family)
MTTQEQSTISTEDFDTLWTKLWGSGRDTRSVEYEISKKQYDLLNRAEIVKQVPSKYTEPEWGFPKGRRMKGETDIDCAVREFWEETNIPKEAYEVIPDLSFTEIFTGTNEVCYKHIYYVAILKDSSLINLKQKFTNAQRREISAVDWKTLRESKAITRPHYTERKKLIEELERRIQIYQTLPK